MLNLVRDTIRKYLMFLPGDRILVGVSGGPDSVALIHILRRLAPELQAEVFIAHLDHCLRGQESAEDARFVRGLAEQLGLPAVVEPGDVAGYAAEKNMSVQAAAREVRYRFFTDAAAKLGCNKLATGHNADDQAETVLLNFLRGSGHAGLAGIPPVRDDWITRPLIEARRAQIEQYCRENHLATRLDKSNLKATYTRNKIRLELIPLLEREYNPSVVETLVRISEIMRDEEQYLESVTAQHWEQVILNETDNQMIFDLDKFLQMPVASQRRITRMAWSKLTRSGQNLEFIHLNSIMNVLRNSCTGSYLNLPMQVSLHKSYGEFSLFRSSAGQAMVEYEYELIIPGITFIRETGAAILSEMVCDVSWGTTNPEEIYIDLDGVSLPLKVRSRKPGDWFRPCGMDGSKKLKKFLIDNKVPREQRERIPVLVTEDNQVIWVIGLRADQRWQATPETKRVLKVKIIRNL